MRTGTGRRKVKGKVLEGEEEVMGIGKEQEGEKGIGKGKGRG